MTITDTLLSIGIIGIIILIFYLKSTKKQFKDLALDVRDMIKSMRDKNE